MLTDFQKRWFCLKGKITSYFIELYNIRYTYSGLIRLNKVLQEYYIAFILPLSFESRPFRAQVNIYYRIMRERVCMKSVCHETAPLDVSAIKFFSVFNQFSSKIFERQNIFIIDLWEFSWRYTYFNVGFQRSYQSSNTKTKINKTVTKVIRSLKWLNGFASILNYQTNGNERLNDNMNLSTFVIVTFVILIWCQNSLCIYIVL